MISKTGNTFYLSGRDICYIIVINRFGVPENYYFGKKIREKEYSEDKKYLRAFTPEISDGQTFDTCQLEYPSYGKFDLRYGAFEVKNSDGNFICQPEFKDYEITDGCDEIAGMPSLFAGDSKCFTLRIKLYDDVVKIGVVLSYTVFDEYNVVARSTRVINGGDADITIMSAMSASVDLPAGNYDVVSFNGAWAREREFTRNQLYSGNKISVSNDRGGDNHEVNPFVMICDRNTCEKYGNVYSMSLIYSGPHQTEISCDKYGKVRMMQGISSHQFEWSLTAGENFATPQSVLCFSECGFGGISRELSDVYRTNLMRSKYVNEERPILINNWEGTYFDFNEEKLLSIASCAKANGIELFVLDDGWFGKRNDDTTSLGDWVTNREKLPNGIADLSEKITALGLKFGLWFEPEMISEDSDLYRSHPDWAISVRGRRPTTGRNQLILDLTRDEVCEYIIKAVSGVLSEANIGYVKWDMNRAMTDMPCAGFAHKYTLGFYKIMKAITESFPDVLFEGCAGGGGRFDAGVLAYMPQIWTSDNSEAVSRLKIQYTTSMGYPVSSMGAHVTASPNHQNGRMTSLKTRADIAYTGIFGYELDITKLTDDEQKEIREQINRDRSLRKLMIGGDFYRLMSPYEGNYCAWEMAAKDKSEAFIMYARILSEANKEYPMIKAEGLDPDANYRDEENGEIYGGDELMNKGFHQTHKFGDFSTGIMHLLKI